MQNKEATNLGGDVHIIFENQDFMCVDKPAGLVLHSDGRTNEISLTDWVKDYFATPSKEGEFEPQEHIGNPHTLDSGRYTSRWGIVNRLDRDTAGLILIAKNQNSFEELQKLFQENKIQKKYQALVWGQVDFQEKIITEKITRHKKDPRIWTCGFTAQEGGRISGREAITLITSPRTQPHPQPLSFREGSSATMQTKVFLYPKTGRTHQLRLHCRFIGHPIVGDDKYGVNGKINEHSIRQLEHFFKEGPHPNPPPSGEGEVQLSAIQEQDKKEKLKLIAKSLEFELEGKKYFFESNFNLN